MQIFNTLIKTEYRTAVALGFFDGVHKGHQDVIKTAVDASFGDCKAAVLTFKNSPSSVISGNNKPLLTTNEEKFGIFEQLNVDYVFCLDFNEIRNMSAQEFVKDVLCDTLNADYVIAGFNYHFGKGGTATVDNLVEICNELGIKAQKCMPVEHKNATVSSTRIRECIMNGDIADANAMLGYNFSITSVVTSGNHIGTTLKTPTINQPLKSGVVHPRFGVYASRVTIDDKVYQGATNIGTHPTVGDCSPLCETHLLNFESVDLYGKKVKTELLHFVRPEKKFQSLSELRTQIENDKSDILAYFNK